MRAPTATGTMSLASSISESYSERSMRISRRSRREMMFAVVPPQTTLGRQTAPSNRQSPGRETAESGRVEIDRPGDHRAGDGGDACGFRSQSAADGMPAGAEGSLRGCSGFPVAVEGLPLNVLDLHLIFYSFRFQE